MRTSINKSNSMSKLFLQLGTALILITVAICVKNNEIIESWFVDSANTYDTTDGEIIESNISHTGIHGGWKFNISYRYFVENVEYISTRVLFSYEALSDKSYAEGYISKYPVGRKVLVYFDPNNPSMSVLEPKVKWFGLAYAIGFNLILSIILFALSWYHKVKEKAS